MTTSLDAANSDGPAVENSEAPATEPVDSPETKPSASGFKLPSRQDIFGIDPNRPRGPEDDEAWLATASVNPPVDAPIIEDQPGDTIDPAAAEDFAAWEEDFGIFDPEQDPEQTDQDSGSNA